MGFEYAGIKASLPLDNVSAFFICEDGVYADVHVHIETPRWWKPPWQLEIKRNKV